jgi:subtilisin family serine protease
MAGFGCRPDAHRQSMSRHTSFRLPLAAFALLLLALVLAPRPRSPERSEPAAESMAEATELSTAAAWVGAVDDGADVPFARLDGNDTGAGDPNLAALLAGADLSNPAERERVVAAMRAAQENGRLATQARAEQLGLTWRIERSDGTVMELVNFQDGRPLYRTTHNANAAISSGAAALWPNSTYSVDGDTVTVGIWDAGLVRSTHQELAGRTTAKDVGTIDSHATHVGGTLIASGVVASARGMAPAARLDSYEWTDDFTEMTARGSSYPGEPGTLLLSNHSYGFVAGWGWTGTRYKWFGPGTDRLAIEPAFGRYGTYTRDLDALVYGLPYYLPFWAAGNDRDNNPSTGSSVEIGTAVVSYDANLHPPGDGRYKNNGFDTISHYALAKNVVTVGAVNDAVNAGQRDLQRATMSAFSSWGATDDGRIKPDLVANGVGVESTESSGDTAYGSKTGTSMAAPSAAGSAALLQALFHARFPGQYLRASALKALLIHTADDLGNPGPDYSFGWGLINVKSAADLIESHAANPARQILSDGRVTANAKVVTRSFQWDGVSPIKATLAWTDPAGSATATGESRVARLVHDLDLLIIGPDGALFRPWVMPHVGDWSPTSLTLPATRGRNSTDNVEQVVIASPSAPGVYQVEVKLYNSLAAGLGEQAFSLIISGADAASSAGSAVVNSFTPAQLSSGVNVVRVFGQGFQLGARVVVKSGSTQVEGFGVQVFGDYAEARIDGSALAGASYQVSVINPNEKPPPPPREIEVWSDSFDGPEAAWSKAAEVGTSSWTLSSSVARSPTRSFHGPAPASRSLTHLISPPIALPADADELRLSFWHRYDLGSSDGALIELSVDAGPWFSPGSAGSPAVFLSGGYVGPIVSGGNPNQRNPLVGRDGWFGTQTDFGQVLLQLDPQACAGKSVRIRFSIGTNSSGASPGWWVDDLAVTATVPGRLPPEILSFNVNLLPDSASADLVVNASGGSGELTYRWSVSPGAPGPVTFDGGVETAQPSNRVRFSKAGSYQLVVRVGSNGEESTSTATVSVAPVVSALAVGPQGDEVPVDGQLVFSATAFDQFGQPVATGPAQFAWSVSGGGSINSTGSFTAGAIPGGPFLVTAALAGRQAQAEVWVRARTIYEWRQATGAGSDLSDDDGDGILNLLEYALGGNPFVPGTATLPQAALSAIDGVTFLSLSWERPAGIEDLIYIVEASSDLNVWAPLDSDRIFVEAIGAMERVTAIDSSPMEESQRFMRLQVRRPEE